MTETTKEIFKSHEVRKTGKEKKSFRNYLSSLAAEYGYEVKTEKPNKSTYNVIVGNPERAEVIYTAHYDTCAVMPIPNFITPKSLPIYALYQLILTFIVYIIPFSMMAIADDILLVTDSHLLSGLVYFAGLGIMILFTYLMMCGPANKHTANDNTSGVTLLIDIMRELPNELKDKVAFIFFDFEELGMIGSRGYKTMHPSVATDKLIINFDCVSDGDNILFVPKKGAYYAIGMIEEAFAPTEKYEGKFSVEVAKKAFYPSDQINFNRGVGVSALNKTKSGILYMNKIHTKKDTVYNEDNIEFLKEGAIKLAKSLTSSAGTPRN